MGSKHSYERHCLDIANAPNEQLKANMRAEINIKHPFCALSTFHITKPLLQDIMCTLLASVVQYEAGLVLVLYTLNDTLMQDRIINQLM